MFVLTFSIDNRDSFENVTEKWLPEITHFCPDTPVVLVGTKADLRQSAGRDCVPFDEAVDLVRRTAGLTAYCETAALHQSGVDECFEAVIRSAVSAQARSRARTARSFAGRSRAGGRRKRAEPRALQPEPCPPTMPPTGKAPWIHPANATLGFDFGNLLGFFPACSSTVGTRDPDRPATAQAQAQAQAQADDDTADVKIELELEAGGIYTVMVHRAVVIAASPGFEERLDRCERPGAECAATQDVRRPAIPTVGTDESCCVICLDAPADFLVVPCGHQCGCEDCLLTVQQASGSCPICRADMVAIQRVFAAAAPCFRCSNDGDADAADSRLGSASEAGAETVARAGVSTLKISGATPRALRVLLHWLYAGAAGALPSSTVLLPTNGVLGQMAPSAGVANLSRDNLGFLNEVQMIAEAFGASELETFICNIRAGDEFLNPSYATFLSDRTGANAAARFMNKDELADVSIKLDDGLAFIPAHRSILTGRCEFFKALLRRREPRRACDSRTDAGGRVVVTLSKVSRPMCLAILEFIYRDHVTLSDGDGELSPIELMTHARQFGLHRLVTLCELQITQVVDKAVVQAIARSSINVIALLNLAHRLEATQLEAWCLHFIASNFAPMATRREWHQLSPDHLAHVTKYQVRTARRTPYHPPEPSANHRTARRKPPPKKKRNPTTHPPYDQNRTLTVSRPTRTRPSTTIHASYHPVATARLLQAAREARDRGQEVGG